MNKIKEINKDNFHNFKNREIIEIIILRPEIFVKNRELKYFLGEYVGNRILNTQNSINNKKN